MFKLRSHRSCLKTAQKSHNYPVAFIHIARAKLFVKRHFCCNNLSTVSKRGDKKTERLLRVNTNAVRFFISDPKRVNWNAFRLNFSALIETFWVYMCVNLIYKQTITA